jgi:hypothetical protein
LFVRQGARIIEPSAASPVPSVGARGQGSSLCCKGLASRRVVDRRLRKVASVAHTRPEFPTIDP